jgi:hypothetical protein
MERFVSGFIRASLVWLGIGALIGAGMVFVPDVAMPMRPAHMHANLLGFVSMMIFGVAYHVIPRFFGSPLRSRAMATTHLYIANAGLFGMVVGWTLRGHGFAMATPVLHTGTLLSLIGAGLFIVNLWRTMDASPFRAAPPQTAAAKPKLPVMQ